MTSTGSCSSSQHHQGRERRPSCVISSPPFPNCSFSVSATSRGAPAHGDQWSGLFHRHPRFRELVDNGAFLEWEEVYTDQYYGTLRSEVDRILKAGRP